MAELWQFWVPNVDIQYPCAGSGLGTERRHGQSAVREHIAERAENVNFEVHPPRRLVVHETPDPELVNENLLGGANPEWSDSRSA
jgi:hypothetical protein